MRRRFALLLIPLVWGALAATLSKNERAGNLHRAPQTPAAPAQPATAPHHRPTTRPTTLPFTRPVHPVTRRSEQLKQPTISLSVNGDVDVELPQGWPLLIVATVQGGVDKSFEFQREGVRLEIVDSKGAKVDWPAKPIAAPGSMTAPATQAARASADHAHGVAYQWVISDTSTIAVGKYKLKATLDGAIAHGVAINVIAPPPRLSANQKAQQFLVRSHALVAAGDHAGALQLAEDQIKLDPRNVLAHHMKADALVAAGRRDEALKAYNKALVLFYQQNPKSPEPPRALMQAIDELRKDTNEK